MRRSFLRRLAVVTAVGSLLPAVAKETHTELQVSATVRASAELDVESAPSELSLSAADVTAGFVEVQEPTALTVRSTSPNGFLLDVLCAAPMVSSMVVRGLDADLEFGADGGTIVQRWQQAHSRHLRLIFRLNLAPGLAPGRYPWPLHVTVRPLEYS